MTPRRRRRRRPSGPRPPQGDGPKVQSDPASRPQGQAGKKRRRRRKRRGGRSSETFDAFLKSHKIDKLQLWEPDGQNLEEMIENLKDEYGTPPTPQEYRLMLKVGAPVEQRQRPSQKQSGQKRPSSKRRRRRRSRGGGAKKTGD